MEPFKQAGSFDPQPILEEIESRSQLWDWLNLRKLAPGSTHTEARDIILRWQDLSGNIQDQWTRVECKDLVAAQLFPRTMQAIRNWAPGLIGRIVIAELGPGAKVASHEDQGNYADWHDRYHFVVVTNFGATNECQGHTMHMGPGQIWLINNHELHSAENAGLGARIHIIVDIRRDKPWHI